MKNKRVKYICIFIFLILCGIFYAVAENDKDTQKLNVSEDWQAESEESLKISMQPEVTEVSQSKIYVDVCGAVVNPGVYQAEEGARVYQLIQMAGGILPEGAGNGINQAATVMDGEQLYVPFQSEMVSGVADLESKDSGESGVNINTAGVEELMTLPGIGESKAQAIIQYREEHGKFQTIEELMNITGIKNGVYEKIKELVRIR